MALPVLSNSYAFLLAGLLACASAADEPAKGDRYFTPVAAKVTSTMPRVIMRNMREDRAGNIWFATFAGPIRYDGKEFRNFSDETGLVKTRVFSLLEDRSGALWFGSITGGAARYDGKSFTKFTDKEGLANNDVLWIFEDRDAKIWFATGAGVSRYDGKTITNFTTKDGLVHNSVYTIGQDASGRIWFGTQGGICSYDGKSFSNLANQVGRSFVNIRAMVVDRSGNLWFGGQEGVFRYDGKTLTTFTSKDGLLDDFVGSMIVDRAGNLWLGHPGKFPDGRGGGASRYDGKSFKTFTQKDGLNSTNVYCMLEDNAGNIWFGSVDAGACRYDGKTFTNFSAAEPPALPAKPTPANDRQSPIAKGETVPELGKSVMYVFQAKNNDFWFGSNDRGVYRYDGKKLVNFTTKDGLVSNQIRGIQEDKSGNIFFTTYDGISKFDGKAFTTLSVSADSSAANWKNQPDDLWFVGAQDAGVVFRYDGQTLYRLEFPKTKLGDEHFAKMPRSKFPNAVYSPYDVYSILRDSKGNLWFGTTCVGVCRFDGKSFHWLTDRYLTAAPVRSIFEDKKGNYWFSYGAAGPLDGFKSVKEFNKLQEKADGTIVSAMSILEDGDGTIWTANLGAGAVKYDGKQEVRFPIKDGDTTVAVFAIYKDNQGILWLGTHNGGAYRFNGKTFERFSLTAKPVQKPARAGQ